jgi:LacI family transcriptional regulator
MIRKGGTLVEVARQCAVSQSTVSRVLNNSRQGRFSVSVEVRERIVRTAQELNYRPSVAARNLAATKTNLVAVLGVHSMGSEQVGPVERAIEAFAHKLDDSGYEICMSFLSSRHAAFDLPQLRVDGVVAVNASSPDDLLALEQSGVPYISMNGAMAPNGSLVSPDDVGGTRAALQHLIELGHRKIAYLDHPGADARHPSVYDRRQAFFGAQQQLGFSAPAESLTPLPPFASWDSYYEPFITRMILHGRATAVLAYSHYSALSLLRRAHDMNLTVPKDFSLICFNDEPIVSLAVPALTAIACPSVEMGEMTAELLLARMNGENPPEPQSRRLKETLVARESTAPPPQH